jgi:putative glycosyltransferase (TIGR04372 family)
MSDVADSWKLISRLRWSGILERMWTGFTKTLFLLKYQPARWLCSLLRLKYAVLFYPDHFGHQAGDVEYDLRTKKKKLFYFAGIIPNKALYRIHLRYCTIVRVPVRLRQYFLETQILYKCFDESLWRQLGFYDDRKVWSQHPRLSFSEEETSYCKKVLGELGLEEFKYIAFHSRDPNYASLHHPRVLEERQSKRMVGSTRMTEEHPFQRHRNVDFDLYFPTIRWLQEVGLKAVRLGSHVERAYFCENLVDYASIRETLEDPDLLDLYLMAHAKLYVGHATGISHLSAIFNTPAVAVNWFPHLPGSRPTPNFKELRVKRLKVLGETLSEFRSRHFFELATWEQVYAASREIETIPNTDQEILETVKKHVDTAEGSRDPGPDRPD